MQKASDLGRNGDVGGLQKLFAARGYRMSGPACGIIASKYARDAGFKPPAGGAVASNWHNFGEKMSPGDINAPNHPFGSMFGTYNHRRYGGNVGAPLPTGATGGHVMAIVPGSYDAKTGKVDVVDQYGYSHGKRNISDMDLRYAGGDAVAAATARRGGPGGSPGTGGAAPAGMPTGGGSPYLASQRAGLKGQFDHLNQQQKNYLYDALHHEWGGGGKEKAAIAERMANEAVRTGKPLNSILHNGFYGPINRGEVTGRISDQVRRQGEAAMGEVFGGSDYIESATDQGMPNEIHSAWRKRVGDTFGDISPAAARWREQNEARKRAYDSEHASASESHPGQAFSRRARLDRAMTHRVEGTGHIQVDVNSPKGTQVRARSAGLFKGVRINRATQMEQAATSLEE
jgi:hypothetical protein